MNRDEIIELAQVAGASKEQAHVYVLLTDELLRFAALIAEDCAKRCEAVADGEELPAAAAAADRCCRGIREAYKP